MRYLLGLGVLLSVGYYSIPSSFAAEGEWMEMNSLDSAIDEELVKSAPPHIKELFPNVYGRWTTIKGSIWGYPLIEYSTYIPGAYLGQNQIDRIYITEAHNSLTAPIILLNRETKQGVQWIRILADRNEALSAEPMPTGDDTVLVTKLSTPGMDNIFFHKVKLQDDTTYFADVENQTLFTMNHISRTQFLKSLLPWGSHDEKLEENLPPKLSTSPASCIPNSALPYIHWNI